MVWCPHNEVMQTEWVCSLLIPSTFMVWFPGVHCDVGGYYKERGLSDGALQWMIHKAESAGVQFKENWQQNVHPDPTAENALHNSRKGFWKLWKPVSRNIPEKALVHQSTLDRINADIGYKPKNLIGKTFKKVEQILLTIERFLHQDYYSS